MAKTYFGFAVADSMFVPTCVVRRRPLAAEQVKTMLDGDSEIVFSLNPSHEATISAACTRFGFRIEVPATAPKVVLTSGDRCVVMSVRGLPRLAVPREYTPQEIEGAGFDFGEWVVD